MHPKHAFAVLAVGLLGCSGEPPAPASTSGAVVVTSSAPATSSSASSAPSAAEHELVSFADADVAWDKLPARVETTGGLAVVKEVLDVTLLPNDGGLGAMIRFVVDHFRPNQQHTYDEPAK